MLNSVIQSEKLIAYWNNLRVRKCIRVLTRVIFCTMLLIRLLGMTMIRYDNSAFSEWFHDVYLIYVPIVALLICLLMKKFDINEIKLYFLLSVLFYLMTINTARPTEAIHTLALIVLVKDEKLDWILKVFSIIALGVFVFTIAFNRFGFISSRYIPRVDGDQRDSLGFWHPNVTGGILLSIVQVYILKIKKKTKIIASLLLLLLAVSIVVNSFTDSRASFWLVIFIIAASMFYHISDSFSIKFLNFLDRFLFLITFSFLMISYLSSAFYSSDNDLLQFIDILLSHRLRYGKMFLDDYSINLYGNILSIVTPFAQGADASEITTRFLDNGYLFHLLSSGVIFTGMILLCFVWISRKMYANGYKLAPLVALSILLFGLIEAFFMWGHFNVILLTGGVFLSKSSSLAQLEKMKG